MYNVNKQNELMKKALEFYANPDTYVQMIYEENEGLGSMILDDEGSIAIKTLKEVEDID